MASIIDSTLASVKVALDPLLQGGAAGIGLRFIEPWPGNLELAVRTVEQGNRGLFIQFAGMTNAETDSTHGLVAPILQVLVHYVDATEWGVKERGSGAGTYHAGANTVCDEIMARTAGQMFDVDGVTGPKTLPARWLSFGEGEIAEALSTYTTQLEIRLPVRS